MHNRKREIVERLLPDLPSTHQESSEQAMITWWANIRNNGGLRLTKHGYEIMHDILRLESWEFDLSAVKGTAFTKKIILDLDRKLEWPYYLDIDARRKRRRVVFFSSREAMLATLYGDLSAFLKQLG